MLQYAQAKDNLFGAIERLSRSVRSETGRSLSNVRAKLQDEAFNLVVLGQFKRGKSTFINALLGESILPTAIVPLTSVLTILRYGPELKIEVHYLDGRQEVINLPYLPSFITERGNPENGKGVKEVSVLYPSEYLKGGVRIIDTPGVGSVYRHNTDVAYSYLPHVDAGIFIVSVDPPLSESEHQFLKTIRAYVDKLFFVLNKIDQVSDEDRAESLEFTTRILEGDLGNGKVKIHPLSARWALDAKKSSDVRTLERSLLPDFEKRLQDFLMNEKGKVFLASIANNLLKLISDETVSFRLEQEAIKLPLQELTRKIGRFEQEMKIVEKDRENNQYLLTGQLGRIISELDSDILSFKKDTLPVLRNKLEEKYLSLIQSRSGGLREELEQFVFAKIREAFDVWRLHLTEKNSTSLEQAHQEFALKINEIMVRILALTSNIFEIDLKPFTSIDSLSKKSDFFFLLKDDPVGLELVRLAVTSALPQFVARKMILKNMRTSVDELVDRHCGRVRYDLVTRMTRTVKDFQMALNEKIDMTLEGIRVSFQKALELHQMGKTDLEKSACELSKKLDSISVIHSELLEFKAGLIDS
jgi:GTP-binding protein EngB required for normal cell division